MKKKLISRARRAGYFIAVCSRLRGCFFSDKSRARWISRVAGIACYFAAVCSRLRGCFLFIKSRVRWISRVAGIACYFAAVCSRLRGCFLFIKSRVRWISRVEITGIAGFGLVDTMITAGVGLTLGLGALKMGQVAVHSAQVVNTNLAEQDLRQTINNLLNNPADCAFNLKPSGLSDKTNKKGRLTSKKLIKTEGNNIGTSPVTSDDTVILESGKTFGGGLIKIQKMALIDPDETNSNTIERTFKVYYSKPRLGAYKTIGGGTCTDGTGATDQAGCYSLSCKMDYHCKDADGDCSDSTADLTASPPVKADSCAPLNCSGASAGGLTNVFCDEDQYLRGFDSGGNKICQDIGGCSTGEVLQGIDPVTGNKICKNIDCPDGESFRGFDENGDKICEVAVQRGEAHHCEAGEYITGFNSEGEPVCESPCAIEGMIVRNNTCMCPENQILSGSPGDQNRRCVDICPAHQEWDEVDSGCVDRCPAHEWWDEVDLRCFFRCADDQLWDTAGKKCVNCPPNQVRITASACGPCPYYKRFVNRRCQMRCQIGSGQRWNRDNNRCEDCPPSTPKLSYNNRCTVCPSDRPHWNSSRKWCVSCLSSTPKWNGSSCVTCSAYDSAKPKWNSSTKSCEACPSDRPDWLSSVKRCVSCLSSTPKWNGSSCVTCSAYDSAKPKWNGSNCVTCSVYNSAKPKWDSWMGRCVTCSAYGSATPKWNGSSCVTCSAYDSAKPKWNYSTKSCEACPSGKEWNGSSCVWSYSSSSSSSSSSSGGGNGDGGEHYDYGNDDGGGSSSGDPGSDATGHGGYL